MKLHRVVGLVLAIQLGAALSAFGQGSYKVEAIGAAPADVPAPIQSTLDTQGVRVTTDGGAPLCEVWLRKTLPTNASPNPESDILYGALTEGALLGVIHFPKPTTDFRSQNIKAGYYTLRFGLILVGKTDNRKAGCGKSASPVWREGKPICLVFPTLSTPQRR